MKLQMAKPLVARLRMHREPILRHKKCNRVPPRSAEDIALSGQLKDFIASKLQQYVTRSENRTAVEAFYRERDFVPIWVNATGALPSTRKAVDFLHGVAADGLDPKDYPTPTLADLDPTQLAAAELTLTNSISNFVRHARTGRMAFSQVSEIYLLRSQITRSTASSGENCQQPRYCRHFQFLHFTAAPIQRAQGRPCPLEKSTGRGRNKNTARSQKWRRRVLRSLQRKLTSSSPIWSAGVGFRETWALPT